MEGATKTALLTDEMRAATRKVHGISDKLVNVKLLIALTNNELYGHSVLLFYYVYAQLELSIEACKDHDALRELNQILPEFARANLIAKDVKFFLGEDWSEKYKPTPAVEAYVKRLKELEKTNPILLVSYCYHMYSALLAGGQMIKKVVKKSFDPPAGEGLNTFEFKTKSRMALLSALKDKINGIAYDDATKQLLLAESHTVFRMNNNIVRSIEGSGRQLMAWILKWIIVFGLIYLEGDGPIRGDEYAHPHGPPHGHAPPQPPMPHQQPPQQGGGGMYYPPPDHHQRQGGFNNRSPLLAEPDFQRGRPRSESRGDARDQRGGYDRFRGRGPGGNRSRSRSPPRGGDGGSMQQQRQHRPSGEWERYDEAAPRKERKATQAIEPMDSYKVFMMRQDENSTPETYQQRYEEYKKKYVQRLMRAFFEDHKKEEWLQERYSPAIRHRLDVQKRSKKITEAKSFSERVRNGTAKICLDENADLPNKDFDNDMEDSTRILYIRRIPCACPVTSLSESIKKAGGNFQQIYLSDPVKKSAFDFDRSAYIIYDTPEAAAEALPKIHNTFVQDADIFAPFRLQVSQHRSRAPLKTPSYLSVSERLSFDYSQALQLASALDKCVFVKDADRKRYGIEALLDHDDVSPVYESEKQKLDVVVAYLRRVHHYIYYAGVQCIDMGDIMHAHPALFCRPEPTVRDLEEEKARQESSVAADESSESKSIGGWAASLDEKVQAYIKALEPSVLEEKKEKDQALVDEIESREEAALESTYTNYCEKAGDDGKHRCRLCTKLFKAADFVKKHIRNKHPELVVDKIAEVGESYMWEQYREDANRPLPPIETTNNLTNPVLGGRGGPSNFQNRGGRNGPYGGGPPRGGYRNDGPPGGYRGRGPPRDNRPRRGSFGSSGGPPRSPPRYNNNRPPPDGDLPVDPRQITKSYQDLDNLQDTKVELSFDALDSLPPPKKKTKV